MELRSHLKQGGADAGLGPHPPNFILLRSQFLMGLFDFFKPKEDKGFGVDELARRIGIEAELLRAVKPAYREFRVPKRSGGERRILAPDKNLKMVQRLILHRVLARLKSHPAAMGFERGRSIVTNALPHVGQAVVVRMDLKNFFESTKSKRVEKFFHAIGWNNEASKLLTALTTYKGSLPQGAPTSPRLANLVNVRLDSRLTGLAAKAGQRIRRWRNPATGEEIYADPPSKIHLVYTRYADDLTFSLSEDNIYAVSGIVSSARNIIEDEGYEPHLKKKFKIRRRHQQQNVTGLVTNVRVALPRAARRRLRAIEHHLRMGRPATLTPQQLAGWRSMQFMIDSQAPSS